MFFLVFFLPNSQHGLCFENSHLCSLPLSLFIFPPLLLCQPNFPRTREENARGKCLHTHPIDPFATMEIPCTPLPQLLSFPPLPLMSHPFASLFLDNSIPSSLLVSLFLSYTHARRCRLLSFSPLSQRYPSVPLCDAGIFAKIIYARRNCKVSSTLFNPDI